LTAEHAVVRDCLARMVALYNGRPCDPRSFDPLEELLDAQAYRLSFWRVAADEINYRRFFDVNDLAALSIERPQLFAATHDRIPRRPGAGTITGVRIDHPDGLFDPRQYLQRLQHHYVLARARHLLETRPEFGGSPWAEAEPRLVERLARVGEDEPAS